MTPRNALDPQVMAATGLHAQPGVYALLLGSGVSTGAGIPTGWGVVRELVRRAAAATDPADPTAAEDAFRDPEQWWAANGDGEPLGYSNLLAALAPTPAARRALLAGFFEPSVEDVDAGLKVPSSAHRAVANLVKRGTVRVIITTNFDRLTERALEDVGVSPQVISNTGALAGMSPLQHAPATVIKLHGDYADLLQRNTVEELTTYPDEWNRLLDRVLSEYGLLVSGWSADWDHALVAAIERLPVRRYPLFWDARSGKSEAAKRLLAAQNGNVLYAADADELFTSLTGRLDALDRLAEPPLTTALAVSRLKRYLLDERRRIDLDDLVSNELDKVTAYIRELPQFVEGDNDSFLQDCEELIVESRAVVNTLAQLAITTAQHDSDGRHTSLWVRVMQKQLNAPRKIDGTSQGVLTKLHDYPALLFVRVVASAALEFERDQFLFDLLTKPSWRDATYPEGATVNTAHTLAEYKVFDPELVNALPRYAGGSRWSYPASQLLRDEARPSLLDVVADEDQFRTLQNDVEYVIALVLQRTASGYNGPMSGEYIGELGWQLRGMPSAEVRLRERANRADDDWPWYSLTGGRDGFDEALAGLRWSWNSCAVSVDLA